MPSSDPRSIRELIDALVDTAAGAEMREPERFRKRLYNELAHDDDPLVREIGEQLRDGVIRPHQLLTIPGYDQVVDRGLEQLQRQKAEEVRAALADYVESVEAERGRPDETNGRTEA